MASRKTSRPVLRVLVALLIAGLCATGCVSMPTGGPVQSYPVTQGADAQNQPYVQVVPQPPGAGWSPKDIVTGFLTASASYGNDAEVVRQYLTPELRKTWNPSWSAVVYSSGPNVTEQTSLPSTAKNPVKATVQISGRRQATLEGHGTYSVASSQKSLGPQPTFTLSKVDGQWRISSAPPELLLTSASFANDYQLSNLYFFDSAEKYLVPDPVYVPLLASPPDLLNGLVSDLVSPPDDWLSAGGATTTAFPKGTKIGDVTLNGVTAVVNLTGAAITKASSEVMEQVSAQLLWTLSGAAQTGSTQGVQSVEVDRNGHPWTPPSAQEGPVQQPPQSQWNPPSGASPEFYYLDSAGYLTSQTGTDGKPVSLAKIGTGYSQVAVSPDGRYLAALRGSTLYTGIVGGTLTARSGSYVALSWDASDNLWASQGDQIVEFRDTPKERQPLGLMVAVNVYPYGSPADLQNVQYTALQVAPDGVRVALVIGDNELTIGAISGQQGLDPQIALSLVQESPVNADKFTGLAWYGADDVITLATPGPAVTEYPVSAVSGGSPTSIPAAPGMETVTASSGQPLIAGLADGRMAANAGLSGTWTTLDGGASGGSPAYSATGTSGGS